MKGEDRLEEADVEARDASHRGLIEERNARLIAIMARAIGGHELMRRMSLWAPVVDAKNDQELVEAISRLAAERCYRDYVACQVRVPLSQMEKQVEGVHRVLDRVWSEFGHE